MLLLQPKLLRPQLPHPQLTLQLPLLLIPPLMQRKQHAKKLLPRKKMTAPSRLQKKKLHLLRNALLTKHPQQKLLLL